MKPEVLKWLMLAINAYPFNNTDEAIYKGELLIKTAHRLDRADKKAGKKAEDKE